jgi:sugar lactone lactonase YvrE
MGAYKATIGCVAYCDTAFPRYTVRATRSHAHVHAFVAIAVLRPNDCRYASDGEAALL